MVQVKYSTEQLQNFWMPFTSNRGFKQKPRMFVSAKDMHFTTDDGRQVLDATAGLWCCNCGHARAPIVEAIQQQAAQLDFSPAFQMGHPKVFALARRLADEVFPGNLNTIFFSNSGSEAVDSALKIALAYQYHRGLPDKTLFVGRERAYHGVNFGGISVGGIPNNKKWYGNQIRAVHMRDTHDLKRNAFSRGLPEHGCEFADDLTRLIDEHGAENIAAVLVEPIAGSTGVLIPPQGYLQRLREICTAHDILLVFDEVITGFGRIGKPTAAERFGVQPDMITFAKGVNSGTVPLGGVAIRDDIYELFLENTQGNMLDLFHGYTYSGHPLASAAGLGALDVYNSEGLFTRALELEQHWEDALHALRDKPHVIDVRNFGLIGAIELAPRDSMPVARAYDAFCDAFHNENLLLRTTGDIIALSPPLIINDDQIDQIFARISKVLDRLD